MKVQGIPIGDLVRELKTKVREDNLFNGAAALGFYLTLAIFPAVVLAMSIIPYLPIENVDQAIMDLLRQALPGDAARMFTNVVNEVTSERRGGLVSTGVIAMVWATSSGMYAIMQQLNVTYDVPEARSFVRARAVAIALSLLFTTLMVLAFSLIVLGGVAQDWIGERFGFGDVLLTFFAVLRWVIIVASLMLAFSLTYYLAPNLQRQKFRLFTPGGAVATVLLLVASAGFTYYVQNFGNYSALYGGIGAVVALMLWLYIAGLSLLIGSVVNVLLERHLKGGKSAAEHAAKHRARPQHAPPRQGHA